MKNQIVARIIAMAMVSMFMLAIGVTCFAALPGGGGDASINWTYLNDCAYSFYISSSTSTNDYIMCGGSTGVPSGKYAYVKVELQQYSGGSWSTYATLTDKGYMLAGVEEPIQVDPGYTYRLRITHEARNTLNGSAIETYTHNSAGTIVSLPRN